MSKINLTVALLAATMFVAAGSVQAQVPPGPYYYGHHGHGMGPQFTGLIDHNGNGVIDADEAAAQAQDAHASMDTNSDGALSKDEYKTGLLRFGPGHGHRHQQLDSLSETRFKQMDKNNDGKVDYTEYMDGSEQSFKAADADKDGKVTSWEYRRQHPHHH